MEITKLFNVWEVYAIVSMSMEDKSVRKSSRLIKVSWSAIKMRKKTNRISMIIAVSCQLAITRLETFVLSRKNIIALFQQHLTNIVECFESNLNSTNLSC